MKLKPCPFCGGTKLREPHDGLAYVECVDCGCYGPTPPTMRGESWEVKRKKAIDVWNRRGSKTSFRPIAI